MTKKESSKNSLEEYIKFLNLYKEKNKLDSSVYSNLIDNESSNANSNDYIEKIESGTTNADINKRVQNLEEQVTQKYKDLEEHSLKIQENIDKISKKQDVLNKQHKELNKKYDELNNMNFKNIEIMSIFFTLFTVISVTANISSNFQELYSSLFFVFSIALLLILFLFLFNFILHKSWDKANKKPIYMLFLLGLIICFIFGYLAKCNEEKNKISKNNISVSEETKPYIQDIAINNSNEKENVSHKSSIASSSIKESTYTKTKNYMQLNKTKEKI